MTAPVPWVAVWPAYDIGRGMDSLIDEALDDLDRVAAAAGADPVGPHRWTIERGRDVPGAGAYPHVLVLRTLARPVPSTHRIRETLNAAARAVEGVKLRR